MLQLTVENAYGEKLNLSNNDDYYLINVTGLTPPAATINTGTIATKDGGTYNSSRFENRNIVLYIKPRRDIEKTRINLYTYIRAKHYIKLYLKNGTRDVWIDGYVETVDGDLYTQSQEIQVSIICTDPYFKAMDEKIFDFSTINSLFEFPFSIGAEGSEISSTSKFVELNVQNTSDEETGVILEFYASELALEPTVYNSRTGEKFTINHEFQKGDIVRLNTRTGEKKLTLIREGVETNILNQMERGSKWFTLLVGDNVFTYTALYGIENLQLKLILQPIYGGM